MALTAEQDLHNTALGLIGEYEITESDTSSKQYKRCVQFYDIARNRTLVSHWWNEAEETVIIPQEQYGDIFNYTYKYALPSDCLKAKDIGEYKYDWEVKGGYILTDYSRTPATWTAGTVYIAGQYVSLSDITYRCNVSHTSATATSPATDVVTWTTAGGDYNVIDFSYIKELTDVSLFSPMLYQAIAYRLAILVVVPLTGDMGNKGSLLQEYNQIVMPQARSIDAMQGKPKKLIVSPNSWRRSRNFG